MGHAVEMYFDAPTESRICSLWDEFAKFGASFMKESGARPHVSLVVADDVDPQATIKLIEGFAATLRPFSLSLSSIGVFPSNDRVAFLAPKVTTDLLALHARFFDQFAAVARGVWPYYAPAAWVPHCTLEMNLLPHQIGPAFDACRSVGMPLECTVRELGLVEFRPVKQIHLVPLSG